MCFFSASVTIHRNAEKHLAIRRKINKHGKNERERERERNAAECFHESTRFYCAGRVCTEEKILIVDSLRAPHRVQITLK